MKPISTIQSERPSYEYSTNLEIIAAGWTFAFILVAATYSVYSGTVGLNVVAWLGLLEIILFYLIVTRLRLRFRSVRFYEDRAVIEKRKSREDVSYSDFRAIELSKSIWFGKSIRIYLKAQERPLIILKNPTNPKSRLDLYSWLLAKTNLTGPPQVR